MSNSCTYVITRGKRKGKTCDKKVTTAGQKWCTGHIATSKKISAALRVVVWTNAFKRPKMPCYCCGKLVLNEFNYHCGHVIAAANGGDRSEGNLRPVCSTCNLSMGTEDMRKFAERNGFKNSPILKDSVCKTAA